MSQNLPVLSFFVFIVLLYVYGSSLGLCLDLIFVFFLFINVSSAVKLPRTMEFVVILHGGAGSFAIEREQKYKKGELFFLLILWKRFAKKKKSSLQYFSQFYQFFLQV